MNSMRVPSAMLLVVGVFLLLARAGAQTTPLRPGSNSRASSVGNTSITYVQLPDDFDQLKIAPGFLLSLSVFEDADYDGSYRVDGNGEILVPVLGQVHVGGQTVLQARIQLREKLIAGGYLNDPQVVLTITQYTAPQVTVLGEVKQPGKYPLLTAHRLSDILLLAGGETNLAGNQIQVNTADPAVAPITLDYNKSTTPEDALNVMVEPGSTVQVKRVGIVYVLGSVQHAGGYTMQEDGKLTLLQAVSLASGTSQTADIRKVYIVRRNPAGSPERQEIAYKQILKGRLPDVNLQATDIVFVPTSGLKMAFADMQALITTSASAVIYSAVR